MSLSPFSLSTRSSAISRPPPLTRGSSVIDSNLATPIHRPGHVNDPSKDYGVPSVSDGARIGFNGDANTSGNLTIHRESAHDNMVHDSYFPRVQSFSRGPATPERNHSARDLINRYESMTPNQLYSPSCKSSVASKQRFESPLPEPPTSQALSALKEKGRSPLRNSFRNLISMFAKKGKGKEIDADFLSSQYDPSDSPSPSVNPRSPKVHFQVNVQPLRSGTVLYLSRSHGGTSLPVWTSCKATVYSDRITLESHTAYGNPMSSTVPLSRSADVHSLSKSQVDQVEMSLLPNFEEDSHLFEISFPGDLSERFAVPSVSERSAWVSSIWDALLSTGQLEEAPKVGIPFTDPVAPELEAEVPSVPLSMTRQYTRASTRASASPTLVARSDGMTTKVSSPLTQSDYRIPRGVLDPFAPGPITFIGQDIPASAPAVPPKEVELERMNSFTKRLLKSMDDTSRSDLVDSGVHTARVSQAISRHNSVESSYSGVPSEAPQHLPTPQSERKDRFRGKSRLPTIPSSPIEDNGSIFDSYADDRAEPTPNPATSGRLVAARSRALLERNDSQRSNNTSVPVIKPFAADDPADDPHPLVTLIQDHAVQQYSQTTDIGHQIASLQSDVSGMASDLRKVIAERDPDEGLRKTLEDVCERLDRLNASGAGEGTDFTELSKKMDAIAAQIVQQSVQNAEPERNTTTVTTPQETILPDLKGVAASIEEMRTEWKRDIPAIRERLASSKLCPAGDSSDISELKELLTKAIEASKSEPKASHTLLNVGKSTGQEGEGERVDKLAEIVALLKTDAEQKSLSANQQAENARYLNELNTWLESFVQNGTTQMQTVARGVEMLCNEVAPYLLPDGASSNGRAPDGLRSDIASLKESVKAGDEKAAQAQVLLHQLIKNSNKDTGSAPIDTETIKIMIEQQKQDQEAMLRGIASELSNDIRGERLRFVEAMKEATAINVQTHVEEFKKELGKEVMMMTCEVGRLQRERQALEQQIADLFAFFAKQRAEMEQNQAERARQAANVPPSTSGRPLPLPMSRKRA